MYEDCSRFFDCPPDDQMVWRYMPLSCFLWMLKECKLYFSRPAQFKDDPYEGTIPFSGADQIPENLKAAYGLQRKLAAISCWHMNDCESVAMWKLYVKGPDGVAIQSRVGALKRLEERSPFVVGKVEYINFQTESQRRFVEPLRWLQPYLPIFQKRKSYQHEQEVRVVILNPCDVPYQTCVPPERRAGDTGFPVSIRLTDVMERIVVSAEYPPFAVASLQQDVGAAGLRIGIERSDLLRPPNKECGNAVQGLIETASGRT